MKLASIGVAVVMASIWGYWLGGVLPLGLAAIVAFGSGMALGALAYLIGSRLEEKL